MPSVQVRPPSLDASDSEPVSKLLPLLRVSVRSLTSSPVTASLKLIVIELTAELRGSGVTSITSAVGRVRSTDHESLASAASPFVAASMMFEPLAVSVS